MPGCIVVYSWPHLWTSHHLPSPPTLCFRKRQRPSPCHHLVPSLFLPSLSFPPCSPSLSLGKFCQQSVGPSFTALDQGHRREIALTIGQVRPSGHPIPALRDPSLTAAFGPSDVHLQGVFPNGGIEKPSTCLFPRPVLLMVSASCAPPHHVLVSVVCVLCVPSCVCHGCHPG